MEKSYPSGTIRTILSQLTSFDSQAFEDYANDVVAILEGVNKILRTSPTYDGGNDGISDLSEIGIRVASSVGNDFEDKPVNDAKKISSNLQNKSIKYYFATKERPSTLASEAIKNELLDVLPPGSTAEYLNVDRLAEIGSENPAIVEKNFPAELETARTLLLSDVGETNKSDEFYWLSLASFTADNAKEIRDQQFQIAILRVISKEQAPLYGPVLVRKLTEALHLGHTIESSVVDYHVAALNESGFIRNVENGWLLTTEGSGYLAEYNQKALAQSFFGKNTLRDALTDLTGLKIEKDKFEQIWREFQGTVCNWFHDKGQNLVASINEYLSSRSSGRDGSNEELLEFFKDIAERCSNRFPDETEANKIYQAVLDVLSGQSKNISRWLADLCASYVLACSLGFEHQTSKHLSSVINNVELIFDTDVIISLLCEAEENHSAVKNIHSRWKTVGDKLLLASPVSLEVAHHAWIATIDFENCKSILTRPREERERLITNAFVRTFALKMEKREIKERQFDAFISQYAGSTDNDATKVSKILTSEYRFEPLLPYSADERVAYERLLSRNTEGIEFDQKLDAKERKKRRDKARRDAEIYASLLREYKRLRAEKESRTVLLLTSARGPLERIDRELKQINEPHLVISVSSALFILSLLPGVYLSREAMRGFLFEEVHPFKQDPATRDLMRAIANVEDYDLPWSSRYSFQERLKGELLDASKSDENESGAVILKEEVAKDSPLLAEKVSEILKDEEFASYRGMANRESENRIRELERKLEEERAKRIAAEASGAKRQKVRKRRKSKRKR